LNPNNEALNVDLDRRDGRFRSEYWKPHLRCTNAGRKRLWKGRLPRRGLIETAKLWPP